MKGSYTHAKAENHRPILRGRIKILELEGEATLIHFRGSMDLGLLKYQGGLLLIHRLELHTST